MTSTSGTYKTPTRVLLTHIPGSWAWMRKDLGVRLLPFALAFAVALVAFGRPQWLGFGLGNLRAQLLFGFIAAPAMFAASCAVQLWLTRRRGALRVPSGPSDAWFQAGFYVINGPTEEAFFRGLMQGGLSVTFGAPIGFIVATSIYVLYHRLGRWRWADVLATGLLGIPLGIAFWLLPGPPSLLGVSVAHIAATCGFLGPGPYLLRKLNLL
jgi:membrane protease YdiL (CAAX protease family)